MKKTSTKVNLVYNMTYQILIMILPLITAPYVARVIGVEGIGIYSYYHSCALYFVYFGMLGISNYGNRSIAQVRGDTSKLNEVFSSIYALQLITSSIAVTIFLLYVSFFVSSNKIVAILLLFHVLSAMFDVSWLFFGLEEFKITVIRQILIRFATLISIFAFVKTKDDLWKYALIMSLGYLVSAIFLWVLVWKRVSWNRVSLKRVFSHIKPCLILFIPIIATSVYRVMDKIMIGELKTMTEVGYYESAEKLIHISMGVIASFSSVIMPKMSNMLAQGKDKEAKKLFNISMEAAMCMGVAITFGIASVSKEFIPIFFGPGYERSIVLSIALSFCYPFISWANIVRVLYLIPSEKDKIYARSIVLGAALNLICNLIFIPQLGAMGAVIGTLVAEASVAIYQTIKARHYMDITLYLKQTLIFIIFGIVMSIGVRVVARLMNLGVLSLIIEIACGAVIYLGCSLVYFIATKNPILISAIKRIQNVSHR